MTRARPLASVPAWIALLLGAAMAVQFHWQASSGTRAPATAGLPPAPSAQFLRIASLGEPEFAARSAMLWLQSFDLRADNALRYAQLDYRQLAGWLRSIQDTDPRSGYALFSAARIYAEVADPDKCRTMLEFLREAFEADPERRWPWLAHAAMLAKHRLNDLPVALQYAQAIERRAGGSSAPLWARQMQAFVLEDMDELEAAKVLLGGLVASGYAPDANEQRFLQARLQSLERQLYAR